MTGNIKHFSLRNTFLEQVKHLMNVFGAIKYLIFFFQRSRVIAFPDYFIVYNCLSLLAFYLRNSWHTKWNEILAEYFKASIILSNQTIHLVLVDVISFAFGRFAHSIFLHSWHLSPRALLKFSLFSKAFPDSVFMLFLLADGLWSTEGSLCNLLYNGL